MHLRWARPPALVPHAKASQTLPLGHLVIAATFVLSTGDYRGLLLQLGQVLHAAVYLNDREQFQRLLCLHLTCGVDVNKKSDFFFFFKNILDAVFYRMKRNGDWGCQATKCPYDFCGILQVFWSHTIALSWNIEHKSHGHYYSKAVSFLFICF